MTQDLTLEQFLATLPADLLKEAKSALVKHSLSGRNISSLPPKGLSFFAGLRQLDLSNNDISDLAPLRSMPSLRHLNISKNNISNLSPLSTLSATLAVLDVSAQKCVVGSLVSLFRNYVGGASRHEHDTDSRDPKRSSKAKQQKSSAQNIAVNKTLSGFVSFPELRTIIASDCGLTEVGFFEAASAKLDSEEEAEEDLLPLLDTLILSRNSKLEGDKKKNKKTKEEEKSKQKQHRDDDDEDEDDEAEIWSSLEVVQPSLKKLSMTDCGITHIPSELELPVLHEFRLARNAITEFPRSVKLKELQILDVGHNKFETLDSLARFPFLKQISVAGNNDANNSKTYEMERLAFFVSFFSDLKILDGKKFVRSEVQAAIRDPSVLAKVTQRVRETVLCKQPTSSRAGVFFEDGEEKEEDEEEDEDEHDSDRQQLGHQPQNKHRGGEPSSSLPLRRHRDDDDDDQNDDGVNDDAIDADDFLRGSLTAGGGSGGDNTVLSTNPTAMAARALRNVRVRGTAPQNLSKKQRSAPAKLQQAAAKARNIEKW